MFNLQDFKALFVYLYRYFQKQAPLLNELDSAIGDGDHGDTILRGFTAAALAVQNEFVDVGALFARVSTTLAEDTGGAIGPLLASFFAEGAFEFSGEQTIGTPAMAAFFKRGYEAVSQVGGARSGDKTLLDALHPAVTALQHHSEKPLVIALKAAADAAEQGAEATKNLTASKGRARFVGERGTGHKDPGAASFAMILRGFQRVAEGLAVPVQDLDIPEEVANVQPAGKFINAPQDMVAEDNLGLALAYPNLVRLADSGVLVRAAVKEAGKVGLAIGHGGGHTPSMGGFVGKGLLDADVYGPLFTCASGLKIARAIEAADRGAGVALLVSNHTGDVLNARMAKRQAEQIGLDVALVLSSDDVATAPRERYEDRRGLGGLLFPLKIGGGAAEAGLDLAEVTRLMRQTNERTATLAVASRAPRHPVTGQKLFDLPEGQIEVGTGVHGEVGVYRGDLMPADELVDLMLDRLLPDLSAFLDNQVWVFLNGSGGTSKMELHILYQSVVKKLRQQDLQVAAGVVGSYFTTLEMGGFSLSLCALSEDAVPWWDAVAHGPDFYWPQG